MFYTDAVKIINYTNILSKTQLELSFWKDNFFLHFSEFCGSFFPRGDETRTQTCCNAFDFSMFWDGVLPLQAYVYFVISIWWLCDDLVL